MFVEVVPTLVDSRPAPLEFGKFGPNLVDAGRSVAGFGRMQPRSGRLRPIVGRFRAKVADIGVPHDGRNWPEFDGIQEVSAPFRQNPAMTSNLGRLRPDVIGFGHIRPALKEFAQPSFRSNTMYIYI